MKHYFLATIFLVCAMVIGAQSYNLQYIIQKVNSERSLTDDQRVKILGLSSTYYPKAKEIQNSKASDTEKLAQAYILKKQLDGELKDILDKKQYSSYQAMCDEYEKKYITKAKK